MKLKDKQTINNMKVAVLQWCQSVDRGEGTIERISTTAKDCVDFLKKQLEGFYMPHFVFSDNGQLGIVHQDCRQRGDTYIEDDFEALEKFIQERYFDWDQLGVVYIRGSHEKLRGREGDYHWWKIMFRNLH
jgi:hypothetical protein